MKQPASESVLVVTRRFWPLAGDDAARWLNWAAGLQAAGCATRILTAQWHSAWPAAVELRDLHVQRLGPSPTTAFRSRRYTRALCTWITQFASQLQSVVIDAHEEDAVAVVECCADLRLPCIVRYQRDDLGLILWQQQQSRRLMACRRASVVVTPNEHGLRDLASLDLPADRQYIIPDGPLQVFERGLESRQAARRALADINYELFLRGDDRLIVCPAEFNRRAALDFLIAVIGPVLETKRGVKCWITGDGPDRERLVGLICRGGWRSDIILPGTFEDIETVISAADGCILPSAVQGQSFLLPALVASGVPLIACDSPATQLARSQHTALQVYQPGSAEDLKEKLESFFLHTRRWDQLAAASIGAGLSSANILARWAQVFERCRSLG